MKSMWSLAVFFVIECLAMNPREKYKVTSPRNSGCNGLSIKIPSTLSSGSRDEDGAVMPKAPTHRAQEANPWNVLFNEHGGESYSVNKKPIKK